MTNDQLTELSAKAIGLKLTDAPTDNGARIISPECGGGFWHPLQSGDDIVRLIAALDIGVDVYAQLVYSFHREEGVHLQKEQHHTHREAMAALRLAVTTLAAQIGMEME